MSVERPFTVAVHAFFWRYSGARREVLLGLRQNTNYGDGFYCAPAGHVEAFEPLHKAVVRESLEEANVTPKFNRLGKSRFMPALSIEHLKDYGAGNRGADRFKHYFEHFFNFEKWDGQLRNIEPDKCRELRFFRLNELPVNTLPLTRHALDCLTKKPAIAISDFGWENPDYPAWSQQHRLAPPRI